MTQPTGLVLEQLRAIRGDLADMRRVQDEHTYALSTLRQSLHSTDGEILRIGGRVDAMGIRLRRIEERLGPVDTE